MDITISRYLIVRCIPSEAVQSVQNPSTPSTDSIPTVKLDPKHPLVFGGTAVTIPDPSYRLQQLLEARQEEYTEQQHDSEIENILDDPLFNNC